MTCSFLLGAHGTSQADTPSLTSSFGHWKAVTNPEIWRSLPFGVSHGQHADDMYKITKARAGGDEVFFSPNDGLFQVRMW